MAQAEVIIKNSGPLCPFSNDELKFNLKEGECAWLKGPSGVGKTTIAHALLNLDIDRGVSSEIKWQKVKEDHSSNIGMLFQQGVLIDSLNLHENIILSLRAVNLDFCEKDIISILEKVGLSEEDLYKMPGELSGGMLRRASLVQVLVQKKQIIILDEPFVGLDAKMAQGIVDDLLKVKSQGISFILISHQEQYAKQLASKGKEIEILPKKQKDIVAKKPSMFHLPRYRFLSRSIYYLWDYLGVSLPLIILAFIAAGLAICLPLAELLNNLNIQSLLHKVESNLSALVRWLVTDKINELVSQYLPVVNREVFAAAVARSFMIDLGPLLTALLLAGRIGGSYAGEVGMMEATNQNRLLRSLGENPRRFNFYPALIAAIIAAPILTFVGAIIGLGMGVWVGTMRGFHLFETVPAVVKALYHNLTASTVWYKVPVFVNFYRSLIFIVIIMFTSELLSKKWKKSLQPRDVPKVITWSVVISCLLIIFADWLLSELVIL